MGLAQVAVDPSTLFPSTVAAAIPNASITWIGEPLQITEETVSHYLILSGDSNPIHVGPSGVVPAKLLGVLFHRLLPAEVKTILMLAEGYGFIPVYRELMSKFKRPVLAGESVIMTVSIPIHKILPSSALITLEYTIAHADDTNLRSHIVRGRELLVLIPQTPQWV